MESIAQIKEIFNSLRLEEYNIFIEQYSSDSRAGVASLVTRAKKHLDAFDKEMKRVKAMCVYEEKYSEYSYIAGIDEVGRGSLAGPVVTCAVILPKGLCIPYVNDSKKVKEEKREELAAIIKEQAVAYALGISNVDVIDRDNILQATYQAMQQSVAKLSKKPDLLLNDAVTIPDIQCKQVPIIKGDAKSISIASASIVAKVARDAMMREYDQMYPEYDFAGNKGYGTAKHIAAIKKYGPCPIHRKTFIKNFV